MAVLASSHLSPAHPPGTTFCTWNRRRNADRGLATRGSKGDRLGRSNLNPENKHNIGSKLLSCSTCYKVHYNVDTHQMNRILIISNQRCDSSFLQYEPC